MSLAGEFNERKRHFVGAATCAVQPAGARGHAVIAHPPTAGGFTSTAPMDSSVPVLRIVSVKVVPGASPRYWNPGDSEASASNAVPPAVVPTAIATATPTGSATNSHSAERRVCS